MNREVLGRIKSKIEEVETASDLSELPSLNKLSDVLNYRIGVVVREDTVEFVRCLHRREIYRYFP